MKHYKIFLTLLLGFFVSTFIHTESNAQVSSIGSVSTTRGSSWTLDGYIMSRTVSKLLSPSNFGPGGTVPHSFTITSEAGTITAATLSQYDIFFIGFFLDGTFSTSELQAMANWVNSGGKLLITADHSSYDAVA